MLHYTTLIALHYTNYIKLHYTTVHYLHDNYNNYYYHSYNYNYNYTTWHYTALITLQQTTTTNANETTTTFHYITQHYTTLITLHYNYNCNYCKHCSHSKNTQLQSPFGPSVGSLCHPWFTTTQPLLWVSYFWNFRHRLVRYYWYLYNYSMKRYRLNLKRLNAIYYLTWFSKEQGDTLVWPKQQRRGISLPLAVFNPLSIVDHHL